MSTHFAHDPAYDGPGMTPTTTYRDGPRAGTSPKCVGCGLPPSWHLAPNNKTRKTLLCWNRERVHGKRSTWNTMGGTYRAPEGAELASNEWRNLIYTLDMVRVDGSDPLTLADMRKRVAAAPRIPKPVSKRVTKAPAPTKAAPSAPVNGSAPTEADETPVYSSACVKCRYARPGDPGDHRDHVTETPIVIPVDPIHDAYTTHAVENVVHGPEDVATPAHRQRTAEQELIYTLQTLVMVLERDRRKAARLARRNARAGA